MTDVKFYVLDNGNETARRHFACRLAEKLYRSENPVHILTRDAAQDSEIDELLWTFRDGSFVPHDVIAPGQPLGDAPVTIGVRAPSGQQTPVVINLADDIPEPESGWSCIAEIVGNDDASRQESRRRYARYRELGHTLETHKL